MNAKWRAGTRIRVTINLNQKHALKMCREHTHPNMNETLNDVIYRYDKASCMDSIDRFMRLILRRG